MTNPDITDEPVRGHVGFAFIRWAITAVVVPFVPIFFLVGLVGPFAEASTPIDIVLLAVVNPIAIAAAAWAMLDESFFARRRSAAVAVSAFALIANLSFAVAISTGASSGDVEIPLIFAAPFVAFVVYGGALFRLGADRHISEG